MTGALLDRDTIERAETVSSKILIALSGGGDSVALLHLLADHNDPDRLSAAIVDHRLREGSAEDAAKAAAIARERGIEARVLQLDWPNGPKRAQGAAREARYRALCTHARGQGASLIAIAHTRDDQAETVLMRAASGSTWRGLAGMSALAPAPVWSEGRGIWMMRPLLHARRAELRAMLSERGASWIEDPSNENTAFARVRARQRLAQLEAAGFDPARLAALAEKLQPLATALDAQAAALIEAAVRWEEGEALLDPARWSGPTEVRTRALSALLAAIAGAEREAAPEPVAALEARLTGAFDAATLGGVLLRQTRAGIRLSRDPGAILGRADGATPLPPLPLDPNQEQIWDGRLALHAKEPGWSVAGDERGAAILLTNEGGKTPLADAVRCGNVTARWLTRDRLAHSLRIHPLVTPSVA